MSQDRNGQRACAPSPRRGEGWGEGPYEVRLRLRDSLTRLASLATLSHRRSGPPDLRIFDAELGQARVRMGRGKGIAPLRSDNLDLALPDRLDQRARGCVGRDG